MKKLLATMVAMAVVTASGVAIAGEIVPSGQVALAAPTESIALLAAPAVGGGGKNGARYGIGYESEVVAAPGLSNTAELSLFRAHYESRGEMKSDDLWEVRALSNAKYVFVPSSVICLYASAGVGVSYVHQHGAPSSSGDVAFAYQAGGGLALNLPYGEIDLGYRYDGTSHVEGGVLRVHSVGITMAMPIAN